MVGKVRRGGSVGKVVLVDRFPYRWEVCFLLFEHTDVVIECCNPCITALEKKACCVSHI